ncbi:MAG: hypothetical protein AAGF84_12045 [Planctomycetota bacterium]
MDRASVVRDEIEIGQLIVDEIESYRDQHGEYPLDLDGFTAFLKARINRDLVNYELLQSEHEASANRFILSVLVSKGALSSDDIIVYFPNDWGSYEDWWTDSEIGWGGALDKTRLNEKWLLYQTQSP